MRVNSFNPSLRCREYDSVLRSHEFNFKVLTKFKSRQEPQNCINTLHESLLNGNEEHRGAIGSYDASMIDGVTFYQCIADTSL